MSNTVSKDGPSHITSGMKILMGDPGKAILKLGSSHDACNVCADSIQPRRHFLGIRPWCRSTGCHRFCFPLFQLVMIALSTGLGLGGGSAIARKLGARDKTGADNVAVHSMIIMLVLSVLFTILMLVFSKQIFIAAGAGKTLGFAMDYGNIIFAGSIVLFFTNVANAVLRSEGNAQRCHECNDLGCCAQHIP